VFSGSARALGTPFETVLASVAHFHGRAAVAGEHVDHFLKHVLLRRGLRGGREIEHEDRDEVAAALEVGDAALDPQTWPRCGRHLEEIDAEVLGDRHAFLLGPGGIGVEEELGVLRQRLVHDCAS
jgi:hypothetical protein